MVSWRDTKGLIYGNRRKLEPKDFSGILTEGGTIIGTSRQPFKKMGEPDENGLDKVKAMLDNYKKWKLDCLVILGGNGTHKTANLLSEKGCNVVTLPNDIRQRYLGNRYHLRLPERCEYRHQCNRLHPYDSRFPRTCIYR